MGVEDISINQCLSVRSRFADLYNVLVFDGEEVITPDKVCKIGDEPGHVLKDKTGSVTGLKRYRDIMMKAEQGELFLLLAVENQQEIHYAMAVRAMLYDALSYTEQVKEKAKENRNYKKLHGAAEYLSGLTKEDRLKPVITIVLYYGDALWDGCIDIHSLLGLEKSRYSKLREYIPNYHINLIDVRELAQKGNYKTDLQWIFGLLQYKDDCQKMLTYAKEHKAYFENLDEDTYRAIRAMLGSSNVLAVPSVKGEKKNMCKALEDLYQAGKTEGRIEGKTEGRIEGKTEGRIEGKTEGKAESIIELLYDLGEVPEYIKQRITAEKDLEVLKKWLKTAAKVNTIEIFARECLADSESI